MDKVQSKNKTLIYWLLIATVIAIANLLSQVALFGLAYQLDYGNAPEWLGYPFIVVSILVAPLPILVAQVDSNIIRLPDYWYVIGAVLNAALWSNLVLYFLLKIPMLNCAFQRWVR